MLNLHQYQSSISHNSQVQVDGRANSRSFWYNHLFYVLFVRPTSVHVAGVSTFSASDVCLVRFLFPGSLTLHSLSPSYCTPTDSINTLSLVILKFYSFFHGSSHEALVSCNFRNFQGHTFVAKKVSKNNLDYINFQVIKKDQTHSQVPHRLISPNIVIMSRLLNAQFIHQRFVHDSHQCILRMSKLGVYI